jgi:mannose-1-phosphate guanylyltransferase
LDGARIGAGCVLRDCIVAAGAQIGPGTEISGGAVLGAGARIGADNVITNGARISAGVRLPDGAVRFA